MKLLLVDGHYYVYRSFFAIRNLSNSKQEPTNAIYGFTKTLRRMVAHLQPDYGAVIWDMGLPERRTKLQPEYKQQRAEMPPDMVPQLDFIQKLVPQLGFHSLGLPNTEADDLMASYAIAAMAKNIEVVLATNDKDLFQLVDHSVKVYSTNKADLASPEEAFVLLGNDFVTKKWGVPPAQIGEVLCLIGDSVDNIPGVPGLGPKNAAALLREHGSLDVLLQNADNIKNERMREKVKAAREQIVQNREMVRLDTDLPLPEQLENLKIQPRYPELIAALEKCEFKSLLQEVKDEYEKVGAAVTAPAPVLAPAPVPALAPIEPVSIEPVSIEPASIEPVNAEPALIEPQAPVEQTPVESVSIAPVGVEQTPDEPAIVEKVPVEKPKEQPPVKKPKTVTRKNTLQEQGQGELF